MTCQMADSRKAQFLTVFYIHAEQKLPSKLKPPGPPKNALKMLLASKSGGDKMQVRIKINMQILNMLYNEKVVH